MTIESVMRDRAARWIDELDAYGYVLEPPGRVVTSLPEIAVTARRPTTYDGPPAKIEVHELWLPGPDPDELGLEAHGCHLQMASWHAQILGGGATGAERLDLDRRKRPELMIHRHPLGEPNDRRVPASPLVAPERWIEHVEALILDLVEERGDSTSWTE
jgi:hypothetical protein